jgi:hypothetical protein
VYEALSGMVPARTALEEEGGEEGEEGDGGGATS